MVARLFGLVGLLLLWVSGCGSDDAASPDAGDITEVSALIGANGGVLELTNGAKVEIPADALAMPVKITVKELRPGDVAPLPFNLQPAGRPLAFEPHGQQFARPVKVTVPFTDDAVDVRPVKLDDEQDVSWRTVVGAQKTSQKLTLETTSFSVYLAARPIRNAGVITLDDGAVIVLDSGNDGAVGDAGADASSVIDAGADSAVMLDAADDGMGTDAGDAALAMDAAADATVIVDRCQTNNGGCDPLVACTDVATDPAVSCGACPSDYLGNGTDGCIAVLVGLSTSAGVLTPTLNTTDTSYAISVDALVSAVTLTPTVSSGATLSVESQPHASGTAWRSPSLAPGANAFTLVASHGAQSTTYTVTVTRNPLAQTDYVKAPVAASNLRFGNAIAISGDTVAVAITEAYGGVGRVHVYVRSNNMWAFEASIDNPTGLLYDTFGCALAIDGDTLVVGAVDESSDGVNSNGAPSSGAAYVFARSGGSWVLQDTLKASNLDAYDAFGTSVAVHGDTVVVGAGAEDSNPSVGAGDNSLSSSGAAYVYVRDVNGNWIEQAMLKASNADAYDGFGYAVGLDGDTIVVGAYAEASVSTLTNPNPSDNSGYGVGAAYVYVRVGAAWTEQAYLKAENAEDGDEFGASVAISNDTIAIGAPYESSGDPLDPADNSVACAGAAYVFARSGATWMQEGYIKAGNPDTAGYPGEGGCDRYGSVVDVDGDLLIVGASGEDNPAAGIDPAYDDPLMSSGSDEHGAAYVYQREAGAWSQAHYLKASNPDPYDLFGDRVAVSGTTLVCSAPLEDSAAFGVNDITVGQSSNASSDSGAVYVFR